MYDTAPQKLPSSRKRWPLLTGPLAIACRTVKLRTTSIPWHQANSGHNLIILISGRQMKSLHEGLVTQVTSIWAPSALWKMDRSQNCGWTRQGCLLACVSKCLIFIGCFKILLGEAANFMHCNWNIWIPLGHWDDLEMPNPDKISCGCHFSEGGVCRQLLFSLEQTACPINKILK